MKVIVIGTVQFTLEMLQVICKQNVELVGVVSGKNRGQNADYVDLSLFCNHNKISHYKTNDVNTKESIGWIQDKKADLIFCLGWSQIIRSQLLNLTVQGIVGYHPSYLPKNRGRHPLVWALVLGLKETGSTFFFMDEGADSGDILSQEVIQISATDDASSLYTKMVETAKQQLIKIIYSFKDGSYHRVPQNHSLANKWRKRNRDDGQIDWRMSAKSIHNLVRGLTHPYVGAHFMFEEEEYKVWKSCIIQVKSSDNLEPGKIITVGNKSLIVKCGEGCIKLFDLDSMPTLSAGVYL